MRASQSLIPTLKETPADAEIISHQLLLRAGMIRKLASGLYTWLPIGLKTLQKVEHIVRDEMQAAGAQEVLMPVVQPADLWQESGRWQAYGKELLRIQDRHQRDFCLGPTHEEVITDLIRNTLSSYKSLPQNFFQIQTKFRDEIRPRFGLMRGREFIMKDAYSFHADESCLKTTYQVMHDTYSRIFSRIGLVFRAVEADTGSIGGSGSHEFHVLADSGEDLIAFSNQSDYAANIEKAEAICLDSLKAPSKTLEKQATPDQKSIKAVSEFLDFSPSQAIKTLIVHGIDHSTEQPNLIALILRGDHQLNEIKAEQLPQVATPLTFASDQEVEQTLGCEVGYLGPKLEIKTYVDRSAAVVSDFFCGANEAGYHLSGVNWQRDIPLGEVVDLRNVEEGDPSPCGQGSLELKRGIEVGHIFQLGQKYSQALHATVLNDQGKPTPITMGCYGIGVSRIVAAAIEQNHDENGIIWPEAIAPFQVAIIPLNMQKSVAVSNAAETLYDTFQKLGIEVYLDDRNERPGIKFADVELIGIPHILIVGDKSLAHGQIEYKNRQNNEKIAIEMNNATHFIQQQLS